MSCFVLSARVVLSRSILIEFSRNQFYTHVLKWNTYCLKLLVCFLQFMDELLMMSASKV